MPRRRRALIAGTGRDRGALAGARSLQRSGWFVGVGTPEGGGMVGASRTCEATHVVPRPRGDMTAFVDGVREAVQHGDYQVVFGGGDDWMAALSAYRDQIPAAVAHPDFEVVRAALDKVELTDQARRAGIAAPHTEPATPWALDRWQGPVVVKCRAHWSPHQTRRHRIDARVFPDAAAARSQVELITMAGAHPVLQQQLRGHLGALVGVFHDGRLHGRQQQATSRLWPTPSGMSSRAQTVPVDEDLSARAETLLDQLGWHGLVELQFLTGADGVPHLIDLNGRFYGSMALANAARPGLIDAWGRMVLGEPVPTLPDAEPGRRYAWMAGDLRRAGVERRGGRVADLVDTVRWGWGAQHSVWDARDLGPTLRLIRERLPALRSDIEQSLVVEPTLVTEHPPAPWPVERPEVARPARGSLVPDPVERPPAPKQEERLLRPA
ncbi:MAG: ATP-grasp domain-containing protein [Actinomycetota bacterium]|nr:ATP-grasp domain-containing protein [Actinomycetota bacterium]